MNKKQEKRLSQMAKAVKVPFRSLFKTSVRIIIEIQKEQHKSDKQMKSYFSRAFKGENKGYGKMCWYVYSGQVPKRKKSTPKTK